MPTQIDCNALKERIEKEMRFNAENVMKLRQQLVNLEKLHEQLFGKLQLIGELDNSSPPT